MYWLFIVGTAGSGKSLLASSLEKWLVATPDVSVAVLNLDPGVESPPYTSDVDIREYIDYGEVMEQFGLGPNGALVASLDMAVSHVHDLRDDALDIGVDYVIVDCPGQMELFAYRSSGPIMVSSLCERDPALSLYLLDSNIARTAAGYLSSMLLGVSINIRFGLPQLNVLSKSDILNEDSLEEIIQWSTEPYFIDEAINATTEGLVREYSGSVLRMLNDLGGVSDVIPISAKQMVGVEALYAEIQRVFIGGDNLYE